MYLSQSSKIKQEYWSLMQSIIFICSTKFLSYPKVNLWQEDFMMISKILPFWPNSMASETIKWKPQDLLRENQKVMTSKMKRFHSMMTLKTKMVKSSQMSKMRTLTLTLVFTTNTFLSILVVSSSFCSRYSQWYLTSYAKWQQTTTLENGLKESTKQILKSWHSLWLCYTHFLWVKDFSNS